MARLLLGSFAALLLAVSAYFIAAPHRPATDARVTTLDGRTLPLSELRGKVTAVNFWATWCKSCLREMPSMVQRWRKYAPRGYEMVAIAVRDDELAVAAFAEQQALPFKVAMDTGEAAQRFGNVRITPTTFLISRDGRVIKRFVGEPDWAEFDALVEKALAD